MLGYARIWWDMLGYDGTWWDMFGDVGICKDMVGYVRGGGLHVVRSPCTCFAQVFCLSPRVSTFD